ncbi:MAG: twin-arginine translocase TatA/TatE family subunit [bacterium]
MGILGLGTDELIIVLVVIVLLFGAANIPKLARSLGRAKGEFNKARAEFATEAQKAEAEAAAPAVGEEQVRKTARGLGIDDAGKSTDEVKRLIQQKLA